MYYISSVILSEHGNGLVRHVMSNLCSPIADLQMVSISQMWIISAHIQCREVVQNEMAKMPILLKKKLQEFLLNRNIIFSSCLREDGAFVEEIRARMYGIHLTERISRALE